MAEDYEPYVADPAEPPPRRRLARLQPSLWFFVALLLTVSAATVFLQGYGDEDPALRMPGTEAGADG
ncbi:MAG TPA: hypothetical protein VM307_05300 [Egibacteraceae bacterium]|nr:hypothetical protein [Egibacteraceae bacterium]